MKHNKKNITINQITISILETIWAVGITVASNGVHNLCLKINNYIYENRDIKRDKSPS